MECKRSEKVTPLKKKTEARTIRMFADKFKQAPRDLVFSEYYADDLYDLISDICLSEYAYSCEFIRILEILRDYWLEELDEDEVQVCMEFRKGCESQKRCIFWVNHKEGKACE